MKLLALDTSTEACSAALYRDGDITSRFDLAPRRHAELILPMIDAVLVEARLTLDQLDAIGFGRGPGSFTGVRIAAGVAQGLAFASGLPLVAVSSLAALAEGAKNNGEHILAAIDARMGELYYGCYRIREHAMLEGEECVCAPDDVRVPENARCFGAGTGWLRHGDRLSRHLGQQLAGYDADRYPSAIDVAVLAVEAFRKGEILSPEQAAPVYLRNKVTR